MSNDNSPSYQDRYAKRLEQERKVNIYYIPIDLHAGGREYLYVAASASLHDQFVAALELNQIPDFSVVVAHGEGEPTEDVKQKMKHYYGYDHDANAAEAAARYKKTGSTFG